MNIYIQRYTLIAFFALCFAQLAMAQISREDLRRLGRLRPDYPFDRSGDYRWIDALRLKSQIDSTATKPSRWWEDAILGKTIDLPKRWILGFDGLVDVYASDNKYDGAWLGYEVFGAKGLGLGRRLVLRSQHYFTTKSQSYITSQRALLFYAPEQSGQLTLDLGISSGNTTNLANEEVFAENFLTNLGTNTHLRSYRKHYLGLRNSLHLSPALRVDALALYEYRSPQRGVLGDKHQILLGELRLAYDFGVKTQESSDMPSAYRLPKGKFLPELSVMYRAAFDPSGGRAKKPFHTYQVGALGLRGAYAFTDYQRLDWSIVTEAYLCRGLTSDYDALTLPHNSLIDRQPMARTWATGTHLSLRDGAWFWSNLNYQAGRLALGHIPLLKRFFVDEQLHLRALHARSVGNWTELGYSIGLGRMLRLGLAWGGDWQGKNEWAFRISLPALFLTSRSSTRY